MAYMNSAINNSPTIVGKAGAAIADAAMLAVKFDANGELAVASTPGEPALGIILSEVDAVPKGGDVSVVVKDITRWRAGGAVAKGDGVTNDANGKAVRATSGDFILGIALEAATAAEDIISVQIVKAGYKA